MHMTLHEMMKLSPKPFDMPLLKMTVRRVLLALDFLHSEAGVVHTGKPFLLLVLEST
jgi:non-specific serine/threonine protein kinase